MVVAALLFFNKERGWMEISKRLHRAALFSLWRTMKEISSVQTVYELTMYGT
jgi:hypothetical protein